MIDLLGVEHRREGVTGVVDQVGELATAVEMEASAVSHPLGTLRHLGLVVGERVCRQVIHALHDDHAASPLDETVFHTKHLRLGQSPAVVQRSA